MTTICPVTLSDRELLDATAHAAASEQRATAELLALLGELDSRRLYLGEGCSSLFTYCTQILRLSEHAAYHRIEAARAARKFPIVLNPDVKTMIRRVPARPASSSRPHVAIDPVVVTMGASASSEAATGSLLADAELAKPGTSSPRPKVSALSTDRYLLRVTLGADAHARLRRAQELMRHSLPDGDVAEIVSRALIALVDQLEKKGSRRRRGPVRIRRPGAANRHIPAHVKRQVWVRDAGRCAFVGRQGRCVETGRLEYHHVNPFARGGASDVGDISLRCRAHNGFESEQVFGPWMPPRSAQTTRSGPS